jgi:toxin ParE1/3/4
MSRYVLTIPAKQDLKDINRYIIRFNPGAARRFNEKFKQQCQLLANFPNMGQVAIILLAVYGVSP